MTNITRRGFLGRAAASVGLIAMPSTFIPIEPEFIPPVFEAKKFSPEAMADIRNWGVDKLDESTRKSILRTV